MDEALQRFVDTFGPTALTTLVFDWAPSLLVACLTVAVFAMLTSASRRALSPVLERTGLDATAGAFVQAVVRFTLFAVGSLMVLDQLGIDTTSIVASLGIAGLTLGFAAQNTLSNLISGLFIFWDRPFVLGDLVEVDGEYGRVDNITLRSTRLVTVDGKMIAIPNAVIANGKVVSYTNFPNLRLDVDVTIGVNEPVGRARRILLDLVSDPRYLSEPAPQVVVTDLGDCYTGLQLRVWIADEEKHVAERFRLREAMKDALEAGGVEMPFETLQLMPITVREEPPAA